MTSGPVPVPLDDVRDAARLLDGVAYRTPVHTTRAISEAAGVRVLLKCENLQRAGSFKVRGAYVRMARLSADEKARGVVAASAGNHAQGVAFAAGLLGIRAVVYMPVDAALPKVAATRQYGAEVRLVGADVDETLAAARAEADRTGAVFIHPFDHPDVVAGQATIALEILEQVPDVRTVVAPLGGGGLVAGLAAASDAPAPTVATFVAELDERAAAQHAPTVEGVTLASLHAAKGLEWDAVFLAGMSEGLMPISLAETDEAVAEERRLLYVGITRAREHLELSFARSRNPGGRATRRRTRFLDGLWPDEPGVRGTRRARAGQSKVRLTGEYDQALFEELREWRRQVAQETDKPAFTVLVDSALAAVAETRPTSQADLARINGLGPAKIERYGATILEIVRRAEG